MALYLLLSDDRLIAGDGVAAADTAAADCRYLVLQHPMLLLPVLPVVVLLLWASQQQEVVIHQSGRQPLERVVLVPIFCG